MQGKQTNSSHLLLPNRLLLQGTNLSFMKADDGGLNIGIQIGTPIKFMMEILFGSLIYYTFCLDVQTSFSLLVRVVNGYEKL